MAKLLASSVVRGRYQDDSHGGVYLIDLDNQSVEQTIDWNSDGINWHGRGREKGIRDFAFDGDVVYAIAGDELFAYTPQFELLDSWRNPYLKHSRSVAAFERSLFITSSGCDSIIGFDLDDQEFNWAIHVQSQAFLFGASHFDPSTDNGPIMLDKLNLGSIYCSDGGMYFLMRAGMLLFNGKSISMSAELPPGSHDARPFRNGVLFNDSFGSVLRYSGDDEGNEDRAMSVPAFDPRDVENDELCDDEYASAGFARGLCVLTDSIVAGGSSPSTISVYDLAGNEKLLSVNLSMDRRNAIRGLEVWPYD